MKTPLRAIPLWLLLREVGVSENQDENRPLGNRGRSGRPDPGHGGGLHQLAVQHPEQECLGITVLDAIECWIYQHGLRHMGEIELARGLVGLNGMTS